MEDLEDLDAAKKVAASNAAPAPSTSPAHKVAANEFFLFQCCMCIFSVQAKEILSSPTVAMTKPALSTPSILSPIRSSPQVMLSFWERS